MERTVQNACYSVHVRVSLFCGKSAICHGKSHSGKSRQPRSLLPQVSISPRQRLRGTLAPLLRASDRPIAMACFRLFTRPPFPAFPERSVPCFLRRIALLTLLLAAFPYLAIIPPRNLISAAETTSNECDNAVSIKANGHRDCTKPPQIPFAR